MSMPAAVSDAQTLKPRAGFLRPTDEMMMLTIPTIGIFACILVRFLEQIHAGGFKVDDMTTLLTTLIFMDSVHVCFTFMLIACLPELRAWSTHADNKPTQGWDRGWSFWKRMGLIAAGLATVVYFVRVSPTSSALRGMATIWLFLELVGPSQHTAAQMRGISFVYNSTIRKAYSFTLDEQRRAVAAEKLERLLFKSLILGDIFYWIPQIFRPDRLFVPGTLWIQYLGGAMVGGSAIGLVLNSFRYPRQGETDKTFFLTRVFLFPFKILTPVGGLAIRATHGSEYLLIFRRIVQSSSIGEKRQKRVYWYTAAVSFFYGLIFLSIWPGALTRITGMAPSRNLVAAGLFITFVVRFTHYYMDAIVFKMSDPLTRNAVGPLLVPANVHGTPATAAAVRPSREKKKVAASA